MSRRGAILQDYGPTIPTQPQDAQLAAASYYQRDKEQANQMKMHQADQKKKEAGDATDYITGLKVPHIGDNTVDLYNDAQMKAVQDKLIGMASKGASVNEIKMAAMPELQKIAQGYTIAKNEYDKLSNGVKEIGKDNPTGDMEALRNIGGKELLNTIFNFDDKGNNLGYKDPSLIPPDKNYLQNINTNENLPKWYKESGAFEKGIKDLPLIPVNTEISDKDKYGNKVKKVYTGHGSVFDEPILNEDGKQIGVKLKSESVPLGRNADGSLIIEQVMPKEQFDLALSNDKAKKDFDLRFNKELEQSGINPDKLDPRAKDVLQRKYAYDFFNRTNIHGSLVSEKIIQEEAPIKHTTNVRVNTGGAKEVPVMDIVTPVKDYFTNVGEQKSGLEGVAQLNLFNNEVTTPIVEEVKKRYPDITADDIYYQNAGDGIWVMKANESGKVDKKNDKPIFKLDSFSNVIGNKPQGQKSKNESLRQAQSGSKPASTKTFNIVDPNTGKVLMKGVDEAAANKAKAKGYKVQ